jgi:organic radical activating enzyme
LPPATKEAPIKLPLIPVKPQKISTNISKRKKQTNWLKKIRESLERDYSDFSNKTKIVFKSKRKAKSKTHKKAKKSSKANFVKQMKNDLSKIYGDTKILHPKNDRKYS